MKVHQITRATLSLALAAIGLLAVAAPASATVFETRVKVHRVVQTEAGDYRVKGRVHSPADVCERRWMKLRATPDSGTRRATDWDDRTNRRGKFSIRVSQSQEAGTFRVESGHEFINREERLLEGHPPLACETGKSRRFNLPPPSEAGIAAAASASAPPDVVSYHTNVSIFQDRGRFFHVLGEVQSEVKKCMDGRRVVLFNRQGGADRKLGTARSDFERGRGGVWGLYARRGGRHVYAKVRREVHNEFVCRGDLANNRR